MMRFSKTNRTAVIVGTFFLGASVVTLTVAQPGFDAGEEMSQSANVRGEDRSVFNTQLERDGTKSVYIALTGPEKQYHLTVDEEIDASTMMLSNGYWSQGEFNEGGFFLRDSNDDTIFSYAFDEYGTESIVFPQPLKLREGDDLFVILKDRVELDTPIEFTFIGTAPRSSTITIE